MEKLRFDGRVAIVTGAGRGIGRAHAHLLAARGALVVVNDVGSSLDGQRVTGGDPASDVVAEIEALGGRAVASTAEVSDPDAVAEMVERTVHAFGRIDVVINNAGVVHRSSFPETSLSDLEKHIDVHQIGAFNVTRAAWPTMVQQRYGRVVITVSTALFGIPDVIAYSSAKGGAFGLGKGLALAGTGHGIKVNMVAPIAFTRMMASGAMSDEVRHRREIALPPDRVAAIVAVLAHEECPTTSELYVVGGDKCSRVFFAETQGSTHATTSPEIALASWPLICSESGYTVPGPVFEGTDLVST